MTVELDGDRGDFMPLATDVSNRGRPAGHASPALRAAPSVTSAGAELRLDRPDRLPGRVDLFDVSGRRIRALPWPQGATSVRWDGRDAGGIRVGPGVYWARTDHGAA
ncbi:MAG: hypothetical protein KC591_15305, partial [Gemmatimonadetes bacterium]|nr:hypothetical protein [Gemmatimonadota bacterium]